MALACKLVHSVKYVHGMYDLMQYTVIACARVCFATVCMKKNNANIAVHHR